jgi:UDP-2,3-diacylglucosamine pyrophosphatase LpxH
LEKHSSTWAVIAGHTHTNSVNEYVFPDGDKLTQIVTGSFGNDRNNWRIIKVTGDKIMVSYPGGVDNEVVIRLR